MRQEGDSQTMLEPRSGDTNHAEQSAELLASDGSRGALYPTAPSHGATESDFRSAIYQGAPGHTPPAPNPYFYTAQAQSSLAPAPPLPTQVAFTQKASSSTFEVETARNASHPKRLREDDDDTRSTPPKHARLGDNVNPGLRRTKSNGSHERASGPLNTGPPSPNDPGRIHVNQGEPQDSVPPRSPSKSRPEPTYSSSRALVPSRNSEFSALAPAPIAQSHQSPTPGDRLASLHDLEDPDALKSLLEQHGEEAFKVVRTLTGKFLDHFSAKQNKFAGRMWRNDPGPTFLGAQLEAGRLIYAPIVVHRGNKFPPKGRDMWWNEGPRGMVYMIKFVPAVIVYNAARFKKLKIITTLHDSINELRKRDALQGYVQVTRYPEEELERDERCYARLRFVTYSHAQNFAWKGPRFMDAESTYDYPHGLPYQLLGEVYDSFNLDLLCQLMKISFRNMEMDLLLKFTRAKEREESERRRFRPQPPQQLLVDTERKTNHIEEDTALDTVGHPQTSPLCQR